MKKLAAALSAFAVVLVVVAACASPKAATTAQAVPAPDFSVQDLDGQTRTLASYSGKVLIVNFWATWCPPCRREIPDFIAAYKELRDEGLEIIGLSVDETTGPALLEWVKKQGINYPIALATPEIVRAFEPGDFIPATIVVDRKGQIRFRQAELMTKETLVRLFNEYK
jgi:cytochrome c biogenesis protein CcmG/thiol:disulfide interchange protein DsbE